MSPRPAPPSSFIRLFLLSIPLFTIFCSGRSGDEGSGGEPRLKHGRELADSGQHGRSRDEVRNQGAEVGVGYVFHASELGKHIT